MIEKTVVISGSGEDKRAHINGLYFDRVENAVRLVSTDGSRLATAEHKTDMEPAPGIIVPKKGMSDVAKFLDNGIVNIGFTDNHVVVRKESETIIIRLLNGDFPKYGDIIARDGGNIIKTDRQVFLVMLKRMSVMYSDSYKGVMFNFDGNKLTVTATNPDIGEAKEDISIASGLTDTMAFNPKFFIETLNQIDDDIVILNIIDGKNPCLIKGENDSSYISVIMPMAL